MQPGQRLNGTHEGPKLHRRQQSAVEGSRIRKNRGSVGTIMHRRGMSLDLRASTLAASPTTTQCLNFGTSTNDNSIGTNQQHFVNTNCDNSYLVSPQETPNSQKFSSPCLQPVAEESFQEFHDVFCNMSDNQLQNPLLQNHHVQTEIQNLSQNQPVRNSLRTLQARTQNGMSAPGGTTHIDMQDQIQNHMHNHLHNQIQNQAVFNNSSFVTNNNLNVANYDYRPSTPVSMKSSQQGSGWNSEGDVTDKWGIPRRVSPGISHRVSTFEGMSSGSQQRPITPQGQPARRENNFNNGTPWPFTPTGSPQTQMVANGTQVYQNMGQQGQQQATTLGHRRSHTVPSAGTVPRALVGISEYSAKVSTADPQTPQTMRVLARTGSKVQHLTPQATPTNASPPPSQPPTGRLRSFNHQRAESLVSTSSVGDLTDIEASRTAAIVSQDEISQYMKGPDSQTGKYICLFPECGKKDFGRKENIKAHVQTHLNDRQYECPVCTKCFVRQHDLKRHAKIHSGTKEYQCPCGNEFARHDALTRHRNRGMCIGAFDGIVRKLVKRGRPKKSRPDIEDRAIKSANQRKKNLSVSTMASECTMTSLSVSEYYSDDPFTLQPGDMAQTIERQPRDGMSSSSAPMPSHSIRNFVFPPTMSPTNHTDNYINSDSVEMIPSDSHQSHPSIGSLPGLISPSPSTPMDEYDSLSMGYDGMNQFSTLTATDVALSGNLNQMVSGDYDHVGSSNLLFTDHSSGMAGGGSMKPIFEEDEFFSSLQSEFMHSS